MKKLTFLTILSLIALNMSTPAWAATCNYKCVEASCYNPEEGICRPPVYEMSCSKSGVGECKPTCPYEPTENWILKIGYECGEFSVRAVPEQP